MWRREDFGIGMGDEIKVINKKSDIGLGTPKASLSVPKLD